MIMRVLLSVSYQSSASLVKPDQPWFGCSDEVDNLDISAVVLVGGEVGVGGGGHHVVDEGDVFGDVFSCPVGEECVQQALVSSIK